MLPSSSSHQYQNQDPGQAPGWTQSCWRWSWQGEEEEARQLSCSRGKKSQSRRSDNCYELNSPRVTRGETTGTSPSHLPCRAHEAYRKTTKPIHIISSGKEYIDSVKYNQLEVCEQKINSRTLPSNSTTGSYRWS